jgi:hypothetical protein
LYLWFSKYFDQKQCSKYKITICGEKKINIISQCILSAVDSNKAGVSSNTDDVPEVSLEEMLDDLNLDDVDM